MVIRVSSLHWLLNSHLSFFLVLVYFFAHPLLAENLISKYLQLLIQVVLRSLCLVCQWQCVPPPLCPNLNFHRYAFTSLHPSPSIRAVSSWNSKRFETARKLAKESKMLLWVTQGVLQFIKSDFLDHLKPTSTTMTKLLLPTRRDLQPETVVLLEAIAILFPKPFLALLAL